MDKMLEETESFLKVISNKCSFVGNYCDEKEGNFCSVGFIKNNNNKKELVLVSAYPLTKSKKNKINQLAKEMTANDFFVGKLEAIFDDRQKNLVYFVYTKQISSCFGIRNKEENYSKLLIETITRLFFYKNKLIQIVI